MGSVRSEQVNVFSGTSWPWLSWSQDCYSSCCFILVWVKCQSILKCIWLDYLFSFCTVWIQTAQNRAESSSQSGCELFCKVCVMYEVRTLKFGSCIDTLI